MPQPYRRAVRGWLLGVAALIFALVVVGGATRLTESGLSITEWQPLTGWIPPLTDVDWQDAFEKYKTTTQYQMLNGGMTLEQFKTIFWWEWTHRLLGRVVGLAFLLPFLFFLFKGAIGPPLRMKLLAIFGLGALQGAVGWWMVVSGLSERVNVSQYRLAFHLTLASAILAMIVWTAQRLRPQSVIVAPARVRVGALALVGLVLCQIYLGALVAGLHAGLLYNTWPLIEGGLVPKLSDLLFLEPWWRNFFENPLTVQFVHRCVAYLLWLAVAAHAFDARRTARGGRALFFAVTVQAALGITTLLYQAPLALALAHQAMAIVVLVVAAAHAERIALRLREAPAGQPVVGAA